LKTLTHHAWYDFLESQRRHVSGSGDTEVLRLLDSATARDDLTRHLEEEFDREILEEAMRRVSSRVAQNTWEAFRLLVFEGVSGAEVASRTGMKVSMTFVAKSRVQAMIQRETERLEGSEA
jgi:DNA-directed RNA polymerase specialized sigma24 family protein